jgi:hypothetical protein
MAALAEGMDGKAVRWDVGEGVGQAASAPGCSFLGKVLQLWILDQHRRLSPYCRTADARTRSSRMGVRPGPNRPLCEGVSLSGYPAIRLSGRIGRERKRSVRQSRVRTLAPSGAGCRITPGGFLCLPPAFHLGRYFTQRHAAFPKFHCAPSAGVVHRSCPCMFGIRQTKKSKLHIAGSVMDAGSHRNLKCLKTPMRRGQVHGSCNDRQIEWPWL